jgi:hypothetical protein
MPTSMLGTFFGIPLTHSTSLRAGPAPRWTGVPCGTISDALGRGIVVTLPAREVCLQGRISGMIAVCRLPVRPADAGASSPI